MFEQEGGVFRLDVIPLQILEIKVILTSLLRSNIPAYIRKLIDFQMFYIFNFVKMCMGRDIIVRQELFSGSAACNKSSLVGFQVSPVVRIHKFLILCN